MHANDFTNRHLISISANKALRVFDFLREHQSVLLLATALANIRFIVQARLTGRHGGVTACIAGAKRAITDPYLRVEHYH